uniref:Uncharacterized protein n=1 Tax=Romanomermis culicivorax TaxID=13658 RepID=A0A915L7W2_ROMCU
MSFQQQIDGFTGIDRSSQRRNKEGGCDTLSSLATHVGDREATPDYFLLIGAVANLARMGDGYSR